MPAVAIGRDDARRACAAQALEALRLGVVPAHHLQVYTVGREVALGAIHEDLARASRSGGLRVVLGDYGSGKTHLLELAQKAALGAGFLAAKATLDSREVQPCYPRRLYHQLARAVRYPDHAEQRPLGLAPLLSRAAEDPALVRRWSTRAGGSFHPYLGPTLACWAALAPPGAAEELSERLLDWVEGAEVASNLDLGAELRRNTPARGRFYALQDHRTLTHLYTLLLGGLAALAHDVGYQGLAVLVDEAEFYSVLRGEDRTFAEVLFRTVAASCLSASELGFDPAALPRGGAAVHRSFPYRFRASQPLYVAFALTHDPEGKALLSSAVPRARFLELQPLERADFVTLSQRVFSLYQLAEENPGLGSELASIMGTVIDACHRRGLVDSPRQALKLVTELVDLARHRPERLKPVLAELRRQWEEQ
ncbi:MAG: DUF2791 family P-loop domain-containing protein [Deltaproteobacteria bacterium]|nr:DUF2791 family P-loop domain-containing protein [Deltaproteobacteria bacterium]